eukprot:12135133-Prorocentrum_lima.AAC.1
MSGKQLQASRQTSQGPESSTEAKPASTSMLSGEAAGSGTRHAKRTEARADSARAPALVTPSTSIGGAAAPSVLA